MTTDRAGLSSVAGSLMILAAIIILLPAAGFAQTAQLVCSPDTTHVERSEMFLIDIVVDESATELHCFNFHVTFDTSLIRLVGIDEGALFDDAGLPTFFFWDSVGGALTIGNCLLGYGLFVDGPGSVAQMQFESKLQDGMTDIIISVSDFSDTALAQIPVEASNGSIIVGNPTCCGKFTGGLTGNTDCDSEGKRNLADINRLIDRVYISKQELCCEFNGNVDADPEGRLNLADINTLIDHVYIAKQPTTSCL